MLKPATPLLNILKGAMVFGLVGPPIGGAVFALVGSIAQLPTQGIARSVEMLKIAPVLMLFSYLLGAAPAAVTGAIAGAFRQSINSWSRCIVIGVVGSAVATIWSFISAEGIPLTKIFVMAAVPALVAGSIVARLFGQRLGAH